MGNSFRITTLASAIGIALIGVMSSRRRSAAPAANSAESRRRADQRAETYIVRFTEPGLLHYCRRRAGSRGDRARKRSDSASSTCIRPRRRPTDVPADASATRTSQSIAQAIGRSLDVTHSYLITMNGVAAELSAGEAARSRTCPASRRCVRAGESALATYHGPEFIGAPSIWDGSAVPGNVGTRGQGVVVGDHRYRRQQHASSFADDPTCGVFSAGNHKLLSAVDCLTTNGAGECVGSDPEANDEQRPRRAHREHGGRQHARRRRPFRRR